MSFSSEVKEELSRHIGTSRHCQIAEVAAIIIHTGYVRVEDDSATLYLLSDNSLAYRKFFTLIKKAFNINDSVSEDVPLLHHEGRVYRAVLTETEEVRTVLEAARLMETDGAVRDFDLGPSPMVTRNSCCKRAYIRDAFMCIGSISDPNKGYHLEFVCSSDGQARFLKELIESFDIESRIVTRKKYFVLYIKEGADIVDLLNIMEAPVSLMNLENLRIIREMRNSINRKVNCEVANITKTVNAAARQIEDITYLRDNYGFDRLPDQLREMAEVRLEHPDAPLKELGEYLDPPVGKSGVNHRLRKLSELADGLRL